MIATNKRRGAGARVAAAVGLVLWAFTRVTWAAESSAIGVTAHAGTGTVATAVGSTGAVGDDFFGLDRLWTLRLTVSVADWERMGSAGGPRERGMGGFRGPTGFEPGVRRPANEPPRPGVFESLVQRFLGGERGASPGAVGEVVVPEVERVGGRSVESGYPWATCSFEASGVVLTNVGIRFKGVSSFVRAPNGYKRPFKLDFGRGVKDRRFRGLTEIYLNNNVNDATQMREALAYDLFRRAGIAAPRTAFAQVYLTLPGRFENRHLGLYTIIESVDREFLARSFGSGGGLLMKPERMQGLQYLGERWEYYGERYQPKEPEGGGGGVDARRMIDFVRFVHQAGPEAFSGGLGEYLEVEGFARFVALNAVLANVDSFIGNGHNYYLYVRPGTGRVVFIPWDLNESFGVHPVSGPSREQMRFSVLRPNGDPNVLVERVVGDAKWGRVYREQCGWVLTHLFVAGRLMADIDRVATVTKPVVGSESRRAREDFERTVLGTLAPGEGDTSQPRHDREWGGEGYRPWGFPEAVEIDNLPLKAWVVGREKQVREELEGRARGMWPRPRLQGY